MMKLRLFFYIVCCLTLFKSSFCFAEKFRLPDDFDGKVTRAYSAALDEDEFFTPNVAELGYIMYELGKYFNDKYDDEILFSEDIVDELRPFFPNDSEEDLRGRAELLQNSLRIYRAGEGVYNKFLAWNLAPETYKKVHSDADYNHDEEVEYMEPPEGEFYKVYNFKKFLTYSTNVDERKAIIEYERKKADKMSWIDKMDYLLKKIEWKKVFFYGTYYKNPLLSEDGVSEYTYSDNLQMRLIAEDSYIDGKTKMTVGLHIITRLGKFIAANKFSPEAFKPKIIIDSSDNIQNYEVLYPIARIMKDNPSVHKYLGDFIIPLEIELKNSHKPLDINLHAEFYVCNDLQECATESLDNHLKIEPYGNDLFSHGLTNFLNKGVAEVPVAENSKIKLVKAVVDTDAQTQVVRLEFKVADDVRSFQTYIEEKDGYTQFELPSMSIHDDRVYVRFVPTSSGRRYDLADSEFEITAVLNGEETLRTSRILPKSSLFDVQKDSLSLGIILLAVLGGFILNFMPCVFPVLSIKIMALSRVNEQRRQAIKKSFLMTVGGIFTGFSLIILCLAVAKYLGMSLGWGMQFQSMKFLIAMIFVLTAFLALIPYVDFGKWQGGFGLSDNRLNFISGAVVVLLSTPCTGPYLATAIGFALTGRVPEMIVVLYGVAFGLSIPYILAYLVRDPENIFPKAGKWMAVLSLLMKIMLYLTICWFYMLIWRQTDIPTVIKLGIIQLSALFIMKLYLKFADYLKGALDERFSENSIRRTGQFAAFFTFGTVLLFFCWSASIAGRAYTENYAENMESRLTGIDYDLIEQKLAQGRNVLLEIKADWCLTCSYNDTFVLHKYNLKTWENVHNLDVITVDWTNYNKDVLEFMEKYGRKGLPFYLLFTPKMRNGIVLPELFSPDDLGLLLT